MKKPEIMFGATGTIEYVDSIEKENLELKTVLRKVGALAEYDGWSTRYPLVYGVLVSSLEGEDSGES